MNVINILYVIEFEIMVVNEIYIRFLIFILEIIYKISIMINNWKIIYRCIHEFNDCKLTKSNTLLTIYYFALNINFILRESFI